jgi:ElaB/YqjD/DUF883 family membrane-anchored ribosome-binding protein
MADEPEVIRHQMEAQRASLAEKLECLERQVTEKVQGAKEAVDETVQGARDAVHETVQSVRSTVHDAKAAVQETLDVPLQTRRHPWLMFGGAVAAGYVGGLVLNRLTASRPGYDTSGWSHMPAEPRSHNYTTGMSAAGSSSLYTPSAEPARAPAAPQPHGESFAQGIMQSFAPEVQKLKGVAIGAVMGIVRDLVTQRTPESLRPQVNEVIENITHKLGGEPVRGHLLDEVSEQFAGEPHTGNGHHRAQEACR